MNFFVNASRAAGALDEPLFWAIAVFAIPGICFGLRVVSKHVARVGS